MSRNLQDTFLMLTYTSLYDRYFNTCLISSGGKSRMLKTDFLQMNWVHCRRTGSMVVSILNIGLKCILHETFTYLSILDSTSLYGRHFRACLAINGRRSGILKKHIFTQNPWFHGRQTGVIFAHILKIGLKYILCGTFSYRFLLDSCFAALSFVIKSFSILNTSRIFLGVLPFIILAISMVSKSIKPWMSK